MVTGNSATDGLTWLSWCLPGLAS